MGIFRFIVNGARRFLVRYHRFRPVTLLVTGYAIYMLVGWLLLAMPWLHKGDPVGIIDALFTSVSAVSTTGLITVNTPDAFNFGGELVILILIQLGGLGYMTFGSFLFLITHELKLSDFRVRMFRTAIPATEDVKAETFVGMIIVYSLAAEILGAIPLYLYFRDAGMASPLWAAIFHSVSAFCTAGFSVFPNSLEGFPAHLGVNLVITVLSLLGALGFIVVHDLLMLVTRKRARLTFTSKIILYSTMWVLLAGAVMLFIGEPELKTMPVGERVLVSSFQAMTAATTVGFNTFPIGNLASAFAFLVIILMVIGASPSGTGGGLKSTTVATTFGIIRSTFRGEKYVTFWKRTVPLGRLRIAAATVGSYVILLLTGTFFLSWVETFDFENVLFEVASALGTVGLSRGITADLSTTGKLIVVALMFVGRVGVLSFGYALFGSATVEQLIDNEAIQEDVVL